MSQTRVQLYWAKSHHAVIQLDIATALTGAALTVFTTERKFVRQNKSAIPQARFLRFSTDLMAIPDL